jgi:hypothetical protein
MTGMIFQPQMSQMNADVLNAFICANLRLTKALKEILEKIEV